MTMLIPKLVLSFVKVFIGQTPAAGFVVQNWHGSRMYIARIMTTSAVSTIPRRILSTTRPKPKSRHTGTNILKDSQIVENSKISIIDSIKMNNERKLIDIDETWEVVNKKIQNGGDDGRAHDDHVVVQRRHKSAEKMKVARCYRDENDILKQKRKIENSKFNEGVTCHEKKGKDRRSGNKSVNEMHRPNNKLFYTCKIKGNEILFGISPCLLALKTNRRKIFIAYLRRGLLNAEQNRPELTEILLQLRKQGVEIIQLNRTALDNMTQKRPHQGICLEVSRLHYTELTYDQATEVYNAPNMANWNTVTQKHGTKALQNQIPVWLALDQILDPMNLGALLRSSYFLGVDGVVVGKKNSCSLTPVVSKASSGVMEIQPVYAAKDLAHFLQSMIDWEIIGTSSEGLDGSTGVSMQKQLDVINWNKPIILVVGSEGFGLRNEIINCCNKLLTIQPGRELHPGIDSLNVSVATGILLHLILTNRNPEK